MTPTSSSMSTSTSTSIRTIEMQLADKSKMTRECGLTSLHTLLSHDHDDVDVTSLCQWIINALTLPGDPIDGHFFGWEARHGALCAAIELINVPTAIPTATDCDDDDDFVSKVISCAVVMLDDYEVRVRLAAGNLLGVIASRYGLDVWSGKWSVKDQVIAKITDNIEREEDKAKSKDERDKELNDSISEASHSSTLGYHDTAGWKGLETSIKCLEHIIKGCGASFEPHLTEGLLSLIYESTTHTNRFVRETCYVILAVVLNSMSIPCIERLAPAMAEHLSRGMADNWSQVRYSASVATRAFVTRISDDIRRSYDGLLVPCMILNRYYVAEGVRLYSQHTWTQCMASSDSTKGRKVAESVITEMVAFLSLQCDADNHAVREAACACIAEMASKLNPDVVRPFVPELLTGLIACFKDESWPVRDASCVACGQFITCYPDACRAALDEELYDLFFDHLADNIWSVREDAAIGLGRIVRAYSDSAFIKVLERLQQDLPSVKSQQPNSKLFNQLRTTTKFGVSGVLKMTGEEESCDSKHTDQPMFSCGSLAPKLRRGGGCMDHGFKRPTEPWEKTDGCIYLMRELAKDHSADISTLLPVLADALRMRDFMHHHHLLETAWKQLPSIAHAIGKRLFKAHIEHFFDSLFYSLTSDNQLAAVAAGACIQSLQTLLGLNIFRGRVEQYNPAYLFHLDNNPNIFASSQLPMAGPPAMK